MTAAWRRRAQGALFTLMGLNALAYVAFTAPRTLQEKSLAEREGVLKEEVELERRRVDDLRRRADTLQMNVADADKFQRRLGPKSSIMRVREEVAALASELGLKVGDRAYSAEEVKGTADIVRFETRMPVAGTYRELAAFLDRLERSTYFVTVDRIELRGQGGESSSGEANLDLTLSAFYRGAPQPGGAS